MKIRDNRFWAVIIAAAFLVLWFAGICVAYTTPAQEPLPDPVPAGPSQGAQAVGITGWCLIGVGFLGVALCAFLGSRPRRRRRAVRASRYPSKVARSVYSPPAARRYQRNIERRF